MTKKSPNTFLFFVYFLPLSFQCGKVFSPENVIIINGTEEDVEKQRSAMEERRKAVRLAKV